MSIAAASLAELDVEMPTTRNLLALIPDDRADWRPHERSFTMGELGLHIAQLPSWIAMILSTEELDLNPEGAEPKEKVQFESTSALLALFDQNVAAARAALEKASDSDMEVIWALKSAGETLFSWRRGSALRGFVMNHLIHHRGQLSVNLRLNDIPLPMIYGPTADTPWES